MKLILSLLLVLGLCGCNKEIDLNKYDIIEYHIFPKGNLFIEAGEGYILKDKNTGKEYLYNTFEHKKSTIREWKKGEDYP